MINDREQDQSHPTEPRNTENVGAGRSEQFNELSELSLEERMAAADRIGIPVRDAGEAAATGAMRGSEGTEEDVSYQAGEDYSGEETDQ